MPKKAKTVEEHLEIIESLLAGIILKREASVKGLAKIMGVSDKKITQMYPQPKGKKEGGEAVIERGEVNDQQTGDETST